MISRTVVLCLLVLSCLISTSSAVFSGNDSVSLTLEQRFEYQRAIEQVYWNHRIWPKENQKSKPALNAVMPDSAIQAKVEDYLRKSNALQDYWNRPISSEQLQAEMDRMIKQSQRPDILSELFAALDNDPYVIAECLARPVLADRLIHSSYIYDARFHGDLKAQAESDLANYGTVTNMKLMGGNYRETILSKQLADSAAIPTRDDIETVQLSTEEFDESVKRLQSMFSRPTLDDLSTSRSKTAIDSDLR